MTDDNPGVQGPLVGSIARAVPLRHTWVFKPGLSLALAVAGFSVSCREAEVSQVPHVIVLTIDTLRRDHLDLYGYDRQTAPNLTELARSSVVFDGAIAAHTNTAPSHASILTGLYPQTHGVVRNSMLLRDDVPTLTRYLADSGFRTGAVVSGVTMRKTLTGFDRDFDYYEDELEYEAPPEVSYDRARRWLEQQTPSEPTFLFVHVYAPHWPYRAPPDFNRRFVAADSRGPYAIDRAQMAADDGMPSDHADDFKSRYDAEILYADRYLGELIRYLKRKRYWDNALVIFASDHGETLDERAWIFDHGGRAYDEQIRIPLLIRFPDDRFAGQRLSDPVHHVDILPTILDWLGIEPRAPLQGRSLLPLLRGERTNRPTFSVARPEDQRVPEVAAEIIRGPLVTTIRDYPLKLIAYPTETGDTYQLFDLEADPGETHNLAAERPGEVEQLRRQLELWRAAVTAAREPVAAEVSEAEAEALRALGYIDSAGPRRPPSAERQR